MRPHWARTTTATRAAMAIVAVALAAIAAPAVSGGIAAPSRGVAVVELTSPGGVPAESLAQLLAAPLVVIPGAASYGAVAASYPVAAGTNATVPVLITLALENASRLGPLLAQLEDPSSPRYHQYLTAEAFANEFAPNASAYATLVEYLNAFRLPSVVTFPDRLAVSIAAPPDVVGEVFHTEVERLGSGGVPYWAAAAAPMLPAPVASLVGNVSGLGASSLPVLRPLVNLAVDAQARARAGTDAGSISLAPVTNGSVQYLYPVDLQTGYDEESLFAEYGYPATADVAALLWSGSYNGTSPVGTCSGTVSPGTLVGPYDPGDLSSFYGNTSLPGEPDATAVDVNLTPSPAASCLASWDTTGVVEANTAELEVLGEMAPGATLYAVSAPGPSLTELVTAFQTVLSPPTTLPASVQSGLGNVSVIDVGWATNDTPDTAWSTDLSEAAARGITLVAASGDSADNPESSDWHGTDAEFPATAGTSTSGAVAVGGLTVQLNPTTDQISNESVWNDSATSSTAGVPFGSAGGISHQYIEPAYQKNSSANGVILGAGRGVPDVAAVANNTLITLTVDGTRFVATNATTGGRFYLASGTGVASAFVAGVLAEIDHVLRAVNNPEVGFVNPAIYFFGSAQHQSPPSGGGVTSTPTGTFDSYLPTTPFYDVVYGHNDVDRAGPGYDLVSGWGSIDAYNLTMYLAHPSTAGVYGDLVGVRDRVHLAGLAVTSQPAGPTGHAYNASLQQDFFVANSLGAPVYQVECVVDLAGGASGLWAVNFTANLSYPLSQLYPTLTIHEVWFPSSGETQKLPLPLAITTTLVPATGTIPTELQFNFGNPVAPILTLEAPGAAFIIGKATYSYSWQGTTYTNGPKDGTSAVGYLAPQFGLLGGPPVGVGTFGAATSANFTATVQAAGTSVFSPATTGIVTAANEQSTAEAVNLLYVQSSSNGYTIDYSDGASDQGVYQTEAPYYPVEFSQAGAPDGATWYVNFSIGVALTGAGSTASISVPLENGSYHWTAAINQKSWTATPSSGTVTVQGQAVTVDLQFGPAVGSVTFKAKGPMSGSNLAFVWYANITGEPSYAGNGTSYTTTLSFGTYGYTVAASNHNYVPTKATGSFTSGPVPVAITVTFVVRTYQVEFVFQQPSPAPRLTIELGGVSDTGAFSSWALDEPKGNYTWSITGLPLGYAAIPSGGVVDVSGPVSPITIKISSTGWGPFGLGLLGYVLVGVVVGVAAVWIAVLLWRRSRRIRREEEEEMNRRTGGRSPRDPLRDLDEISRDRL